MDNRFLENLIKVEYVSSGRFLSSDQWIHPKRVIDSYEIIYVLDGCIYIQEEQERFKAVKGDMLLLEPGKLHFGYRESTGKTSFYWLHFLDPSLVAIRTLRKFTPIEDSYQLNLLFRQLLHISNTPEYPVYTVNLLLWLILTEIITKQNEEIKRCNPVIKNICEWIRINSNKKITVRDAAIESGYSEDYLTRLFKANFSINVKDYIIEMKMKYIKNLLLSTAYPIKQIARESGFDDYKGFIKYFKYHADMSPNQFRKLYFNTHMNKK